MKKPEPIIKRAYTLPAKITCRNGHTSDRVVVMPSGPHEKACCETCGAYIKFLKTGEGLPIREKGEDRAGPRASFLLVSATVRRGLGFMTEPVKATPSAKEANAIQQILTAKGRIVHVDAIEGQQKERRVRP